MSTSGDPALEIDETSLREIPAGRALVGMVTTLRRRAVPDPRRAWPSSSFAAQLMATQASVPGRTTPAEAGTAYVTTYQRTTMLGPSLRRQA
jgi:hypothetical protein